jgi:hypothetical protein
VKLENVFFYRNNRCDASYIKSTINSSLEIVNTLISTQGQIQDFKLGKEGCT